MYAKGQQKNLDTDPILYGNLAYKEFSISNQWRKKRLINASEIIK